MISENARCQLDVTGGLDQTEQFFGTKKVMGPERTGLRDAVTLLSDKIAEAKDPDAETASKYKAFVLACQRQTDNIQPRKIRFNTLFAEAF